METKDRAPLAVKEIEVVACDNELYLLASNAYGSSELLHYKSGYNKPVKAVLYPGAILVPGRYNLNIIGINWGGGCRFELILRTDQGDFPLSHGGLESPSGVVWHETIQIATVTP